MVGQFFPHEIKYSGNCDKRTDIFERYMQYLLSSHVYRYWNLQLLFTNHNGYRCSSESTLKLMKHYSEVLQPNAGLLFCSIIIIIVCIIYSLLSRMLTCMGNFDNNMSTVSEEVNAYVASYHHRCYYSYYILSFVMPFKSMLGLFVVCAYDYFMFMETKWTTAVHVKHVIHTE